MEEAELGGESHYASEFIPSESAVIFGSAALFFRS